MAGCLSVTEQLRTLAGSSVGATYNIPEDAVSPPPHPTPCPEAERRSSLLVMSIIFTLFSETEIVSLILKK